MFGTILKGRGTVLKGRNIRKLRTTGLNFSTFLNGREGMHCKLPEAVLTKFLVFHFLMPSTNMLVVKLRL